MLLKLSYQLKINCYIYKIFQVSLRLTIKQEPIVDTSKIRRRESKYTTTNNQYTKEGSKRGKKK